MGTGNKFFSGIFLLVLLSVSACSNLTPLENSNELTPIEKEDGGLEFSAETPPKLEPLPRQPNFELHDSEVSRNIFEEHLNRTQSDITPDLTPSEPIGSVVVPNRQLVLEEFSTLNLKESIEEITHRSYVKFIYGDSLDEDEFNKNLNSIKTNYEDIKDAQSDKINPLYFNYFALLSDPVLKENVFEAKNGIFIFRRDLSDAFETQDLPLALDALEILNDILPTFRKIRSRIISAAQIYGLYGKEIREIEYSLDGFPFVQRSLNLDILSHCPEGLHEGLVYPLIHYTTGLMRTTTFELGDSSAPQYLSFFDFSQGTIGAFEASGVKLFND